LQPVIYYNFLQNQVLVIGRPYLSNGRPIGIGVVCPFVPLSVTDILWLSFRA